MSRERVAADVVACHERDSELNRQISLAERERLVELVLEWRLRVERERQNPFVVQKLNYKSGDQSTAFLDGDRPKEPQLLT